MRKIGETRINELRKARGLVGCKSTSAECILKLNLPVIVPINEIAFGGKPPEWNQKALLTVCGEERRGEERRGEERRGEERRRGEESRACTHHGKDFIFLRDKNPAPLPPALAEFITGSKKNEKKLLVLGFSSMPVKRGKILKIASMIATKVTNPGLDFMFIFFPKFIIFFNYVSRQNQNRT
jgi:hypothetical protein